MLRFMSVVIVVYNIWSNWCAQDIVRGDFLVYLNEEKAQSRVLEKVGMC